MSEHELWVTALLNHYLAGPANAVVALVGLHVEDPAKPWSNALALELFCAVLVVIFFA